MSCSTPSTTSEDSQGDKKVRKRKAHQKVRSGCITCKIRRKKCDETKPSCIRCTSTGRKCDGYQTNPAQAPDDWNQPPGGVSDNSARTEGFKSSNAVFDIAANNTATSWATVPRQPAMRLFLSDVDLQCFDYFRLVTAQQLGAYHDSIVWRSFVVRSALIHPVILKSAAALGAVHRRYELGISREAFRYCEIANRLFAEANQAYKDFERYGKNESYANEIVMMAKMIQGAFQVFQGDFDLVVSNVTEGLATLWNRPFTVTQSRTIKYTAQADPHLFTDLYKRLGNHAAQLLGRKPIVLADHNGGQLPDMPTFFSSLQHGLDLLYTQIDFLLHVPIGIWRDDGKLRKAQIRHVQYVFRWNAALAETITMMGERTTPQLQACFLLRRIRYTIYVLLYLTLFMSCDKRRNLVNLEMLKNQMHSTVEGDESFPFVYSGDSEFQHDKMDVDEPQNATATNSSDNITAHSPLPGPASEPVITSPALWSVINEDEDLLYHLSLVRFMVDSFLDHASTFDQMPFNMSWNIDSGVGPPRSSVIQPDSSSKVRHLIRSLLEPDSREQILVEPSPEIQVHPHSQSQTQTQSDSTPNINTTLSRTPNNCTNNNNQASASRLYNIAEQLCALEEHAVFAAVKQSNILPEGVEAHLMDATCFLEERKMLVQYCHRESSHEVLGPNGLIAWTQKWVKF